MLIGILSDSHDRSPAVRRAMALFDALGVEHVIHCGDVGGIPVFDEVVGRAFTFVWGNMDQPDPSLLAYLETVGIKPPAQVPRILKLDGRKFAVFHGHERGFGRAAETLDVDYILHGHSHQARDETVNGIRVINPGALVRARPKTVAILDTITDQLAFHDIREP